MVMGRRRSTRSSVPSADTQSPHPQTLSTSTQIMLSHQVRFCCQYKSTNSIYVYNVSQLNFKFKIIDTYTTLLRALRALGDTNMEVTEKGLRQYAGQTLVWNFPHFFDGFPNMLSLSITNCRSHATVRARQHHSVRVLQPRTQTLPQLLRGAGGVPRGGGRGHVARGRHVVNTDKLC